MKENNTKEPEKVEIIPLGGLGAIGGNCTFNMKTDCTLCGGDTLLFKEIRNKKYYSCTECSTVILHPEHHLLPEDEKKRYLEHNNDVDDPRYQKTVEPLVNLVKCNFDTSHKGLDFGAGTGPVITKLLRDCGYKIDLYDPYFCNEPAMLEKTYDYIVACEVIEHFMKPDKEFKLLKSLLNKNGMLICKTSIYNPDIDFEKWKYKDDATHVIFYQEETLKWITNRYNFSSLSIEGLIIIFNA
jgi:hypothetical protein